MRIAAIVIGVCGLALVVAGCSNCPDTKWANCTTGNSWDFYAPCDLIDGRAERCCQPDPCGTGPNQMGVVMITSDCVPVSGGPADAVVIEEEIIEDEGFEEVMPADDTDG